MSQGRRTRQSGSRLTNATAFALAAFAAPFACAHHSIAVTFNLDEIVEIEGEITRVLWRNPHVRLNVRSMNDEGHATDWWMEGGAVSRLARWGVEEGTVAIGDSVRLAGFPSRRRSNEMFGLNLLLSDGREIMMDHRSSPRWRDDAIGGERLSEGAVSADLGLFRVWTSDGQNYDIGTDEFPFTDAGRAARNAFDPVQDNPLYGCLPKGMPTIMQQPFPMEFVDNGEEVHLRIEEYDLLRVIYMEGASEPSEPPTILGDSVGRWEEETLVVTTTNIGWPYSFGQIGIPQSDATELVERFTVVDDGARLRYEITANDPATFTEPLTLTKYYLWVPGLEIRPYECTEE
ncbi:MAG: DUF6152 family protein [Rhodospirillaceae bacterium]|nr:DUF6152 family protein [Rhodospirillaceae bacterium]